VWSILLGLNLKLAPSIPWAVPVMAVFLWTYWRYLGGKGWPSSTAETRRASLRVHRLSGSLWVWAIATGLLSVLSAVNLQSVYARLVRMPFEALPDLSRYPFLTVLGALLMSAAVAGFMEEAGFRGYMQVPLECRRYGPVMASTVVALVFGLWHFSHGFAHTVPRLPYYFAISIIYSAIAYLSKSLMPVVAIRACGDAIEFLYVWLRGMPHPKPLLWQSGPDAAFWIQLGIGLVFGFLAIVAFRKRGSICPRASNGLWPRRSNLVGYVRWGARSDRFPPFQTIIPTAFRSQSGLPVTRPKSARRTRTPISHVGKLGCLLNLKG
jgi:membrane protease YdiL (CAAX protease family)